jgi:CRISPR-associated protein Cmr4
MNNTRILYLFTRTPLHVGAGASVGAIDQPIIRERHTGFPIIPASSLKGALADEWNDGLLDELNDKGETKKVRVRKDGSISDAAWLFGSDSDKHAAAGALQFSEAKLLAFPIRSAKGSFAWITCPLILNRYHRAISSNYPSIMDGPIDEEAVFQKVGPLDLDGQIVLEEYTFKHKANDQLLNSASEHLAGLLVEDQVWSAIKDRLVILSDGMMSFFAQNACEVAQHVRINDATGTAEGGALFNQENVPTETLFYSIVNAFRERTPKGQNRTAETALDIFKIKVEQTGLFQFGGDASTGLGYCTVKLDSAKKEVAK